MNGENTGLAVRRYGGVTRITIGVLTVFVVAERDAPSDSKVVAYRIDGHLRIRRDGWLDPRSAFRQRRYVLKHGLGMRVTGSMTDERFNQKWFEEVVPRLVA